MAASVQSVKAASPELEAIHRAFVTEDLDIDLDWDRAEAHIRRLARRFGEDARSVRSWAAIGQWRLERQAVRARAWAAKHHRGAPLDLEGFASYWASTQHSHLERPHALAWGRSVWFQSLAVVAHWEAARVVVMSRMAAQRAYARRDARLEREAARRRSRAA